MNLEDAIATVLELARQNVLEWHACDGEELRDERLRQLAALEIVQHWAETQEPTQETQQ